MAIPKNYLIATALVTLIAGCKDVQTTAAYAPANVPSSCPIRAVAKGMTLRQVKSALKPWHLQYRGEHQDEVAYHVNAGTDQCRAFIHLNSQTHRVDDVEYGEGNFTPPYASAAHTAPQSRHADVWVAKDPVIPDFRNGEVVTRADYVLAFVSENEGVNNLSDDQLTRLGSESWDEVQTAGLSSEPAVRFFSDWQRLSSASRDQAEPRPQGYYPDVTKRIYSLGESGVERPILIHSVRALYTPDARDHRVAGKSLVELVINDKGIPEQVATAIPLGYGLDESAIAAVRQYRFKPATHFGVPVAIAVTYSVDFSYEN